MVTRAQKPEIEVEVLPPVDFQVTPLGDEVDYRFGGIKLSRTPSSFGSLRWTRLILKDTVSTRDADFSPVVSSSRNPGVDNSIDYNLLSHPDAAYELGVADNPVFGWGKYRELVPELIVCVCDEKPKRKLALLATLRSDDSGYSIFDPFGEAATGPPFQIVLTDENLKVLQTIVKGAASPPDLVVTRALIHTIFTRDVT